MSKFGEDLFQSIDTIVQARLENLPYDKTIVCTIKSLDSETIGKYTVSYQNTDLIAYSEKMDYLPNEEVYVSVQQGDFSKKKIIIGRVIEEKIEEVEVRPYENFLPITPIIDEYSSQIEKIYNVSINSKLNKMIADIKNLNLAGYESMGIKFSLSANLKNKKLEVISGNYYINILLQYIDQNSNNESIVSEEYNITFDDMVFINPYDTKGYGNQEKVFNIKDKIVKGIKIQLCQDNNFKDTNDELVSQEDGLNLTINIKKIKVELGYQKPDLAPGDCQTYFYSTGLYTYGDNTTRELKVRVIQKDLINDEYKEISGSGQIYFGKLNPKSSQVSIRFNGIGYEDIQNFNGFLPLQKDIEKETVKASFYFNSKYYVSEKRVFKNINYITNTTLKDALLGLYLTTPTNSQSVFNEYGQDKQLLNSALQNQTFDLILVAGKLGGISLSEIISINVLIPSQNSMLLPAFTFAPTTDAREYNQVLYNQYSCNIVTKLNDLDTLPTEPNELVYYEETDYIKIPFKIKDLYNQTYTNNTIVCECKFGDNGADHIAEKEILFGFSGSVGSDYILKLKLQQKDAFGLYQDVSCIDLSNTENQTYYIKPELYNYTMSLETDYEIRYSWQNGNYSRAHDPFEHYVLNDDFNNIIKDSNKLKHSYIKGTVIIKDIEIIGYLPIAYSIDPVKYNHIAGTTTIVYDITGKKPYYYSDKYILYDSTHNDANYLPTWELNSKLSLEDFVDDLNLLTLYGNKIIPPNVYSKDLEKGNYITAKIGTEIVWYQPICILQNRYPSAMWNGEGNQMTVGSGDDEKKIKTNVVGRFDTDGDCVFMGIVEDSSNQEYFGLFGYQNNEKMIEFSNQNFSINFPVDYAKAAYKLINNSGDLTVGSTTTPVYFENGVPKVCTSLSIKADSAKNADIATTAINYKTTNGSAGIETTINNLINRISELEKKVTNLEQNNS